MILHTLCMELNNLSSGFQTLYCIELCRTVFIDIGRVLLNWDTFCNDLRNHPGALAPNLIRFYTR